MADFEIGNWVQVRRTPDPAWDHWSDDMDILCGKVFRITNIQDDLEGEYSNYPGQLLKLDVAYDSTYTGKSVWFHDSHCLLSSAPAKKRIETLSKWAREDRRREDFQREERDRIFRHMCKPLRAYDDQEEVDIVDEWDEPTLEEYPLD